VFKKRAGDKVVIFYIRKAARRENAKVAS